VEVGSRRELEVKRVLVKRILNNVLLMLVNLLPTAAPFVGGHRRHESGGRG